MSYDDDDGDNVVSDDNALSDGNDSSDNKVILVSDKL
jgi:hypothetical protein